MRSIKFRARASYSDKHAGITMGDFVYGSFIQSNVDAPSIVWGDGEQMEVDLETIGQYTRLKDKNGKEIIEGDLVINEKGRVCKIDWHEHTAGFDATFVRDSQVVPYGLSQGYEPGNWPLYLKVIGNIYESLELMKSHES